MKIREATEKWVDSFDTIQQDMIAKLMKYEPDEWEEVTVPIVGDLAHIYDLVKYGEIIKTHKKKSGERVYDIKLQDGTGIIYTGNTDSFFIERDTQLPMWGTMWSFSDSADNYWLEHMDGIEKMSKCGIRIFESAEFGYFFGIDGAGYDFYESHWIPLYKARGLQWHDPATEVKNSANKRSVSV